MLTDIASIIFIVGVTWMSARSVEHLELENYSQLQNLIYIIGLFCYEGGAFVGTIFLYLNPGKNNAIGIIGAIVFCIGSIILFGFMRNRLFRKKNVS